MSKILRFRRRKRLKGLGGLVRPSLVGRIERMKQQRKLTFIAILASAVLTGAAIGWMLI